MSSSTINPLLQQAVELHRSGRVDEAVRAYKKVLRKDARAIGVLNLLGLAEFQLGHLAEAADALTRAARLNPDLPNIDYNLGRVLQAQERFEDALVHYQKAVAKAPQDAEALSNLGTVLAALKRSDEAIAYYQRAVSLDPRHGDAWFNLGNALKAAERYDEAFTAYSQVLALRPEYTAAVGSLVYVLCRLDRHREAIEYARRIIAVEPSDAGHHMNLANALAVVGRDEEALIAYDTALALDPVWSDILWNKGLFFLSRGRFAEGWPLYEERWRVSDAKLKQRAYSATRWTGERVSGPLLVWAEQGLGDQVLYSSMISDLRAFADEIVLEVDPRLVALMSRSFPDVTVIPQGHELFSGKVAAQAALGDIGRYLRPDGPSFRSSAGGYLKVDHARAAALRARLRKGRQHVIGLSWGSSNREFGRFKSAQLSELAAVLQIPNCQFVDLQYGETGADRAAAEAATGIRIERVSEIDNTNDIDGLAALMAACDAVVSVSNTNAHLAAAQGKATFVILSDAGALFCYWMKRGDTTPFYGSARLFRKQNGQTWPDLVAANVAPKLTEYLASLSDQAK